jgi:hypothetical protein
MHGVPWIRPRGFEIRQGFEISPLCFSVMNFDGLVKVAPIV